MVSRINHADRAIKVACASESVAISLQMNSIVVGAKNKNENDGKWYHKKHGFDKKRPPDCKRPNNSSHGDLLDSRFMGIAVLL